MTTRSTLRAAHLFAALSAAAAPVSLAAQEVRLPMRFEPNAGQVPGDAAFVARGRDYEVLVDQRGFTTALLGSAGAVRAVRFALAGAAPAPISGEEPLPGNSNYLHGRDAAQWRRAVPQFARLRQHDVLTGVDLVYHGNGRQLEYDLELAAGLDARALRLQVDGVDRLALDHDGALLLHRGSDVLRKAAPVAWQLRGGERAPVACRYLLHGATTFGFEPYGVDATLPLVIDPVIVYATFLGASGEDTCRDVAVDAAGNAFLTGYTISAGFPVAAALQGNLRGTVDAWVAKLDPTGATLLFSTFLGGTGSATNYDDGLGIAVDGAGQPVITGKTSAPDFPVTPGAFQPHLAGGYDAFVTKLLGNGSGLVFSTYLGGTGNENVFAGGPSLAVGCDVDADAAGNTWVVGSTTSTDFPTRAPLQPASGGSFDVFLTVFDASGTVVTSTYLGGDGDDLPTRLARDGAGNIVVCGESSGTFPVTAGVRFPTGNQAFVAELDPGASRIVWASRFPEVPQALAVDGAGNVCLGGRTSRQDFPVSDNAWQRTYAGATDASRHGDGWLSKLSPDGRQLLWSTYLGTFNSPDRVTDMKVDALGDLYILCNGDAVAGGAVSGTQVVKFANTGTAPCYELWVASSSEGGTGLAVSPQASVWVAGTTSSAFGITSTAGAFQRTFRGFRDGYVVRADERFTGLSYFAVGNTRMSWNNPTVTGTVSVDGLAPAGGVTVALTATPANVLTLPASVTIPAGTSSATFPIVLTALPRGSVHLTASSAAITLARDIALSPGATYRLVDLSAGQPAVATSANAIGRNGHTTGATAGGGYLHRDATGQLALTREGIDVNTSGQVALPTGVDQVAIFTPGQGYTNVPLFSGPDGGRPEGINDQSWVVGAAYNNSLGTEMPFLWRPGLGSINLGSFGGPGGAAYDVNNLGVVVGTAYQASGFNLPFVWRQGTGMQSLGLLPGDTFGTAYAVNDAGEACGATINTRAHGFVYSGGALHALGTLDGDVESIAFDLNAHGQVVGQSRNAINTPRALLYTPSGGVQDLETLLDPEVARVWVLHAAHGVNDLGQIVGVGTTVGQIGDVGFRLDPAHVVPYGNGCRGLGTSVPALAGDGLALIGGSLVLRIAGGTPAGFAVLAFGFTQATLPMPGGCNWLMGSADGATFLPMDAAGRAQKTINVPAGLSPMTLFAQSALFDVAGGNTALAATNGVRIDLL